MWSWLKTRQRPDWRASLRRLDRRHHTNRSHSTHLGCVFDAELGLGDQGTFGVDVALAPHGAQAYTSVGRAKLFMLELFQHSPVGRHT